MITLLRQNVVAKYKRQLWVFAYVNRILD